MVREDICENCGRSISANEEAFVQNEKVVCRECNDKLSERVSVVAVSPLAARKKPVFLGLGLGAVALVLGGPFVCVLGWKLLSVKPEKLQGVVGDAITYAVVDIWASILVNPVACFLFFLLLIIGVQLFILGLFLIWLRDMAMDFWDSLERSPQ